jgi:hypothetical protein
MLLYKYSLRIREGGEAVVPKQHQLSSIINFFGNVKALYPMALGIEILCIASSELGLIWLWIREGMSWVLGIICGFILFVYLTFITN